MRISLGGHVPITDVAVPRGAGQERGRPSRRPGTVRRAALRGSAGTGACRLHDVDCLITDSRTPASYLEPVSRQGYQVIGGLAARILWLVFMRVMDI